MRILSLAFALVSLSVSAGTPNAEWTALGYDGHGCDLDVSSAVELADGRLIFAGAFSACDDVDALGLVVFDPQSGQFAAPPGNLHGGSVSDLILQGDSLFVAGESMNLPGISGNWGFARLELATGQWSTPIADMENQVVFGLAEVDGEIYISSSSNTKPLLSFTPLAGTTTTILSTAGFIGEMAADQGHLLVGGSFTQIGGIVANNLARYDPVTANWSALGISLDGTVYAIASDADAIYVGGDFTAVNGQPTDRVARFARTGAIWEPVGNGTLSASLVWELVLAGDDLFATGRFDAIDGIPANNIARYDSLTKQWEAIGSGLTSTLSGEAYFMRAFADQVYVGGSFQSADGLAQSSIARFHAANGQWLPLGDGPVSSADGGVFQTVPLGNQVILAGNFTQIGGVDARRLAQMDCETFQISPLGGVADHQINGTVSATTHHQGWLYIGGSFTSVAGLAAPYVARYHLSTGVWEALPGSPDNLVETLYIDGDDLYVSGFFQSAGGASARGIVRLNLNTLQWHPLGVGTDNGINGVAYALHRVEERIFVGGLFQQAGDVTVDGFAAYLPDSDLWLAPGAEFNDAILTMTETHGGLYVGGQFNFLNGEVTRGIARLDLATGAWSAPSGPGQPGLNFVLSLFKRNGQLIVGGLFDSMGGVAMNGIGSLDPTTQQWTAFGQGVEFPGIPFYPSGLVDSTVACGDQIIVGGGFQRANGQTSTGLAFLRLPGPIFLDDFE